MPETRLVFQQVGILKWIAGEIILINYFFVPALRKTTGGMAVISQIAACLYEEGYRVRFTTNGTLPPDFENPYSLPVIQIKESHIAEEDRWIIPEGWPVFLEPGLKAHAKCAAYVQNWAFLHGILPDHIKWAELKVSLIAVSYPVSIFIEQTAGLKAPVIGPALNHDLFYPSAEKSGFSKTRIAWMPRKNKNLAHQIRSIFEAVTERRGKALPEWIAIDNMSKDRVAEILRIADIFLATGFPEGFGLPPLEAMACGCLVAGFTGIGGWEYMRNALENGFNPPFPLPAVPWGNNGFFVSDGDVWGASLALEKAYDTLLSGKAAPIIKSGLEAALYFNKEKQKREILALWENRDFWR